MILVSNRAKYIDLYKHIYLRQLVMEITQQCWETTRYRFTGLNSYRREAKRCPDELKTGFGHFGAQPFWADDPYGSATTPPQYQRPYQHPISRPHYYLKVTTGNYLNQLIRKRITPACFCSIIYIFILWHSQVILSGLRPCAPSVLIRKMGPLSRL